LITSPLYRDNEYAAALASGHENPGSMVGGFTTEITSGGQQPPGSPPALVLAFNEEKERGVLAHGKFMQSSQKLKAGASLAKATKAIRRQQDLTKKLSNALQGKALFVFEAVLEGGKMDAEKVQRKVKAVEMFLRNIRMEGLLWGPPRQLSGTSGSHKIHIPCTMEGKLFAQLDTDGDGKMDREEFAKACREGGVVQIVREKMVACVEIETAEVIVQQL